MTKDIWINLPVKDVNKSMKFFSSLGFAFNNKYANGNDSACMIVGDKNVVVMLFQEEQFKKFTGKLVSDTKAGSEVLFSIGAESREEVDELAKKASDAGGHIFGKPSESQGWMYGCGFSDLDGHRWNVLYMDMEKMPK